MQNMEKSSLLAIDSHLLGDVNQTQQGRQPVRGVIVTATPTKQRTQLSNSCT